MLHQRTKDKRVAFSSLFVRTLKIESGELAKYKLDLMGVQGVRWDKGGTEPAGEYTFLYGNGNADHHLRTGFSYIRGSYQQLRG
jgi:hypothetical protein